MTSCMNRWCRKTGYMNLTSAADACLIAGCTRENCQSSVMMCNIENAINQLKMARIDGVPVVHDTISSTGASDFSDVTDGIWAQSLIQRFGSENLFFQLSFDGVEVFSKYCLLYFCWSSMTSCRSAGSVEMGMAVCLNIRPEYRYRREYMIPVFIGCGKGNIQGPTAMTILQFKRLGAIIVNIVGDLPALKNALGRVGHTAYEACHLCTDKATRLNNAVSFHGTKGEPSPLLEEQVVIQGLLDDRPLKEPCSTLTLLKL